MERSYWCDGCWRRSQNNDETGVPHPTCDAHLRDGTTRLQPVPVGDRMPIAAISGIAIDAPYVICAHGVALTPSGTLLPVTGTGVHLCESDAARSAIYEVLERQSLYTPPHAPLRYATALQLPQAATVTVLDRPQWWIEAKRCGPDGGEEGWWIPLAWTTLPSASVPGQAPERYVDSTGAAVHNDRESAIEHGLLEWRERQILRSWCRSEHGFKAEPAELPPLLGPYREILAAAGARLRLVILVGSPTVAIAAIFGRCGRAVGGAAAAATEDQAAIRAVAESYGKAVGAGVISGARTPTVTAETVSASDVHEALKTLACLPPSPSPAAAQRIISGPEPLDHTSHFVVDRTSPALSRYGVFAVQVVASDPVSPWGGEFGATLRGLLA